MVFDALPQGKLCICTKKLLLRQIPPSCSDFVMRKEDTEKAADLFLTMWQENIRLWAAEKDLLPHSELAALLGVKTDAQEPEARGNDNGRS